MKKYNKNIHYLKKKPAISVLIATKDRAAHLKSCLLSILHNNFSSYEIIVVDQSHNNQSDKIVQLINNQRIQYIKTYATGKSSALNIGLSVASGDIITFTDDDCVVHKNWLNTIHNWLNNHSDIEGVFGSSLPFNKEKKPYTVCAATFFLKKEIVIRNPYSIHYKSLGLGNNMSLRKKLIQQIGNFTHWLGTGTVGLAGEDSDYIYRILNQGYSLGYNPKIIIYHNKWLPQKEEQMLQGRYSRGAVAFSFFHMLNKHINIYIYIKDRIQNRVIAKMHNLLKLLIHIRLKQFYGQKNEITYIVYEIYNILYGIGVATYMFIKNTSMLSSNTDHNHSKKHSYN